MNRDGTPRPRERDTVVASLELFRDLDLPRSLTALVLFLYVCENEGLSVSELAKIGRVDVASAARITKTLSGGFPDEALDERQILFDLREDKADLRIRKVYLSQCGRDLRDQIETLIRRAVPIHWSRRIEAAVA